MNKISQLISLLGGTGAVAEKLKIQPSAISNWKKLNKIPSTKRQAILELSSYLNVDIENFLPSKKLKFDITISAIVGIAGLEPTIKFINLSKKILLANKESIICGWNILKKIIKKYKTNVIPIDSEHFSIKQLTSNFTDADIKKIFITASGGPFLKRSAKTFHKITFKDASKHPKWKMGKKISIDSSNMMNKVLEIIEAIRLFPFHPKKYEIIIHPQSLIHAIILFKNCQKKLLIIKSAI